MTQGTKIGLLVSLAFLIVVFVLLSDHAVHSNDVRPAPVTNAAPTVARGLTVPGAAASDAMPASMQIDAQIQPAEPVPTVQEMMTRPSIVGTTFVDIGPAPARPLEVSAVNHVPTNVRIAPPVDVGPDASVMVLGELPAAVRSEVVPVNALAQNAPPTPLAVVTEVQPIATKHHEYKAMPGDTVSRIARKYYGSDTKSHRDLIVAANASLKTNPDKIVVGKTYLVPVKQAAVPTPVAPAAPTPAVVAAQPASTVSTVAPVAPAPETPAASTRIYVVKSGDNLWKIASTQCKNASAVTEIRKLNRDVLKHGDALQVGMKLRLPN